MGTTVRRMQGERQFDWRPIDQEQVPEWAALLAAIEAVDREGLHLSADDLLEGFDDPNLDLAHGSVGVYDGDTMVGYCELMLRSFADPVHEMRQLGGVHPAYRGSGLGGRLLEWAEQAAVPLHEERYPGRPLSLSGDCLARNAAAVALYEARGHSQARWFHGMTRDLSAEFRDVPTPAGVEVAGFTAERSHDAFLVRNDSFRDNWGSTPTTAESWAHFTGQRSFRPALSFLAYAGQEPLGIIICQEYESRAAVTGQRDCLIELVGTRPLARGRGIASALLLRALAEARMAGFATASLVVDADSPTGAVGIYQRAGFTVQDTWIAHLKPLLT